MLKSKVEVEPGWNPLMGDGGRLAGDWSNDPLRDEVWQLVPVGLLADLRADPGKEMAAILRAGDLIKSLKGVGVVGGLLAGEAKPVVRAGGFKISKLTCMVLSASGSARLNSACFGAALGALIGFFFMSGTGTKSPPASSSSDSSSRTIMLSWVTFLGLSGFFSFSAP
jgi:hypothetical protein